MNFPAKVVDLICGRADERCEMCGGPGTNTHHRRPRGMGGSRDPKTNRASNGLRLCGSGTTGCHGLIEGDREWARRLGYLVRQGTDPATVPVLLMRPGGYVDWVLLDDDGGVTPCCACGLPIEADCAAPGMAHLKLYDGRTYMCRASVPVSPDLWAHHVRPSAQLLGVPVGTDVQVEIRHHGQTAGEWALVQAVDEVAAWLPDLRPRADEVVHRDRRGAARLVREFHERMGCRINEPWSDQLVAERVPLILEECREATDALWSGDLAATAKELADLVYVAYGAALNLGIDLDLAVALVHASNMSKLDDTGRPIFDAAGKVLKGPNYQPPDMTATLPPTRRSA